MPPLLARLVFFCILKNIYEGVHGNFLEHRGPFSRPEHTFLALGQLSGIAWATLESQGGPGLDL